MWGRFTPCNTRRTRERGDVAAGPARFGTLLISLFLLAGLPAAAQEEPATVTSDPAATSSPSAPAAAAAGVTATETETPGDPATAAEPAGDPVAGAAAATKADPFATDYLRLCAGCHTIGGGPLSGPDLLPATAWQRADLRVAVKRMETNVGPMSDEQVDGLTDLLKSADLQARLEAARELRVQEMAATLDPGQADVGRQLFFGERRFVNGGMGCFGCHAVAGRGGNMAKDLTMAHPRLGEQSLLSATEKPAFPMMVASYGTKPVMAQEATHIAAFLKETAATTTPGAAAQPATEALGMAHAGAGVLFLAVVAGVALLARSRRAGVRERMVRDSFRR